MLTEEEWNRAFELTVPTLSLGIGILSVGLAIMSLQRSLAQRVYYEDGQYLVAVRYPWELHDIRSFVTPDDPAVQEVYSEVGPDAWALYDWVCREVDYRRDFGEFFQWPGETIAIRQGDCEDTSNLLTSLLRCRGIDAYTVLGNYQGYGHAWTAQNGFIYETTYTRAMPVPDPEDYQGLVAFNNFEVIESYPGALAEVFSLGRNEATKLNLVAEALGA